ncbi:MAG: hypothetical protein ABIH23_30215 [bacterium]
MCRLRPVLSIRPFPVLLLSVIIALGAVDTQAKSVYDAAKRIPAKYVPAPETTNLSEEALKDKKIAEKLDKEKLLYTGRVVVDEDPDMLVPPNHIAPFEGTYYTIAETPSKVEFGVIPATPRFFPEPPDDHHRAFWASWGQSAFYPKNGRFYAAIGDNGSYDAHLYLVEYNPATMTIGLSAEINEVLGRPDDVFSEGKIHGCLDFMDGPYLWFCTYWSKYPEVHEEDWATGYTGGHIMAYNVDTKEFFDFGVPMLRASWPGNRVDTKRRMLYAIGYDCEFLAWDIEQQKVNWAGHPPDGMIWSNRVFLIDEVTGKVYTSNQHPSDPGCCLIEYDPLKNNFTLLDVPMPVTEAVADEPAGEKSTKMRAITGHRDSDGLFYGVTHAGELFCFDPEKEKIVDMGINWPGKERYTTSIEISPGNRYLYYAPGAHGHGNRDGSPLIQYDIETGQRKVLAFFTPYYFKKYGYTPSGAFSLKLDDKGENLFICWNGGFFAYEDTVGEKTKSLFIHNSIMRVQIPESERQE